ncbi:MAG: hypothetical protein ACYDAQ_08635 [Mycobacteriales bacterium]
MSDGADQAHGGGYRFTGAHLVRLVAGGWSVERIQQVKRCPIRTWSRCGNGSKF